MEYYLQILSFNIKSIQRFQNQEADLLANVASRLIPSEDFSSNIFSIELIFRPSIPDNITNRLVFDDDVHVLNFLMNECTFKDSAIDEITHDEDIRNFLVIHPHKPIKKALNTTESISTHVLRLEKFYDL